MQKGIIKNVNRLTGEPVDAQDLASIFTGIVGNESGVLTVFDELRLEKISDNKVRLHSGVYSLKGHMLYIPKGSYEDFEIDSGTLGANRIDLLVAEYIKNGEGEGEDTLRFRVIKGETTSGTAQAPQLTQQDINSNGLTRQEALYQIRMSGTSINIVSTYRKTKSLINLNDDLTNMIKDMAKIENDLKVFLYDNNMKGYVIFKNNIIVLFGRNTANAENWVVPIPFNIKYILHSNVTLFYNQYRDVSANGGTLEDKGIKFTPFRTSTGETFTGIQAGSYFVVGIL